MSIQNIMNTCFAICITLLIYQNTQLKDDTKYIKKNYMKEYEVVAIAEDTAERVAESCLVSGYVDVENERAYMLNISC